jgi:translocator assembly and maintenance protein 41
VIKYGVIARQDAIQDLREWDQLYTAGRLHKPVLTLAGDAAVSRAQHANVRAAVATALLLLPDSFLTPPLHRALCGLSYRGARLTSARSCMQKVGGTPSYPV